MARLHVIVVLLAAAVGYGLLAKTGVQTTSQLQSVLFSSVKDQPWLAGAVDTLSLSVKRARLEIEKLLGKTPDLVAQVPRNAVPDTLTASCKLNGKVGQDQREQAWGTFLNQTPTDMPYAFLNTACRLWL
jgi:hypothetical protein